MVHFPGFAPPSYGFRRRCSEFTRNGFPHSEISGSQAACASPKLIAACHVLHRLLAPRHPPYALSSLTIKFTREQYPPLEVQAPGESNALLPASLFTLRIQLSKIGSRSRPTAPRATLRRSMPPTLSEWPASNSPIAYYTLRRKSTQLGCESGGGGPYGQYSSHWISPILSLKYASAKALASVRACSAVSC